MTGTEYKEYVASPAWLRRRAEFLSHIEGRGCSRCGLPRSLAFLIYDQDFFVRHMTFAHVGCEPDEDLEALCGRCHDIAEKGKTERRQLQPAFHCSRCKAPVWDHFGSYSYPQLCNDCSEKSSGGRRGGGGAGRSQSNSSAAAREVIKILVSAAVGGALVFMAGRLGILGELCR